MLEHNDQKQRQAMHNVMIYCYNEEAPITGGCEAYEQILTNIKYNNIPVDF